MSVVLFTDYIIKLFLANLHSKLSFIQKELVDPRLAAMVIGVGNHYGSTLGELLKFTSDCYRISNQ